MKNPEPSGVSSVAEMSKQAWTQEVLPIIDLTESKPVDTCRKTEAA